MRKLLTLVLALLCANMPALQAQKQLADSIRKILNQPLPDTSRAFNMIYYAMYMEQVDINKAHELYKEALTFSLKKQLPFYAGMTLRFQAVPYQLAGDKDRERANLQQAIGHLEKDNSTKTAKELGLVLIAMGSYYRSLDQYDSAVAWHIRAFAILEKTDADMTLSYSNLAAIYQQLKLPEKQKEYVTKALSAARKSNKKRNLYTAYLWYTHYLVEVKLFDEAKKYLDSAAPYFSPGYAYSLVHTFYLMKAITHQSLNENDSAVLYYNKAYDNAKANNNNWGMVEPKIQIGHIYYGQKKYREAEAVTREGLSLAEKDSLRSFMQEAHGLLGKIYEESGRYKEATTHTWKYIDLRDSVEATERKTFALELEKKYETEKKDNQLLLQQATIRQKSTLNYVLIAGAAALMIITALSYANYRKQQQLQQKRIVELENEKQLTATEAVLKGEEQERTRLAKDLHDGLGGMLSGIKHSFTTMKGNLIMTPENQQAFERSMDMLDSSIKEMRRVAHNMMPEVLVKYGLDTALKDFCIDINKSSALQVSYQSIGMDQAAIDQTTAITLYRIAQELLNNVIKHAAASQAIVQLSRSGNQLSLTVEDNGKGFDPEALHKAAGIGWSNIRNRVDFLKGRLDIRSSPDSGSSILVEADINV